MNSCGSGQYRRIAEIGSKGPSLLPRLHGQGDGQKRDDVICELDYSIRPLANALNLDTSEARMFMIADQRWKLIPFEGGFRSTLFDLKKISVGIGRSGRKHGTPSDRLAS